LRWRDVSVRAQYRRAAQDGFIISPYLCRRRRVLTVVGAGIAAVLAATLAALLLIARPPALAASPPATEASIWSVRMLTPLDGWASGPHVIARTSDGAATFQDVTPSLLDSNLGDVTAIDMTHAWMLVSNASGSAVTCMYRTENGGITWSALAYDVPANSSTTGVTFIDPQHGWAEVVLQQRNGSHQIELLRTLDGGTHWSSVYQTTERLTFDETNLPAGGCQFGMPAFANARFGVAPLSACPHGIPSVAITRDGGTTWKSVALPEPAAPAGTPLFTETSVPTFVSPAAGSLFATVCVSPGSNQQCAEYGAVMATSDGGATWTRSATVRLGSDAPLVSRGETWIANACAGFCPGWDGTPAQLLHLDSGSLRWTASPLDESLVIGGLHAVHSFQFVNTDTGFDLTAGWSGPTAFFRTDDGGKTWTAFLPRLVRRH
jgi:photosystem II stability/assembly factor-like uncharacterized protein